MFLASFDILGPIATVRVLVVQQSPDAQLLGGRSVPAGPVPSTARLVAEDSVEPVAVLGGDRSVGQLLALAVVGPPWVVTSLRHSAVLTGKHKSVGTVVQLWNVVDTLPVTVAVLIIIDHLRLDLAGVLLTAAQLLGIGAANYCNTLWTEEEHIRFHWV